MSSTIRRGTEARRRVLPRRVTEAVAERIVVEESTGRGDEVGGVGPGHETGHTVEHDFGRAAHRAWSLPAHRAAAASMSDNGIPSLSDVSITTSLAA